MSIKVCSNCKTVWVVTKYTQECPKCGGKK